MILLMLTITLNRGIGITRRPAADFSKEELGNRSENKTESSLSWSPTFERTMRLSRSGKILEDVHPASEGR